MATPLHVRTATVAVLNAKRDEHGRVPTRYVEERAYALAVHPSTIRNWLNDLGGNSARTTDISPELVTSALAQTRGNISAAYRVLVNAGVDLPSEQTFRRRVKKSEHQTLAMLRGGEKAFRDTQLYIRHEAEYRNQVWQTDHADLDVRVLPPRSKTPVRPYLTAILDCSTRMCLAFGVSVGGYGGAEMIVATLAKAVTVRRAERDGRVIPGGEIGGAPEFLRHDLGADFRSQRVQRTLAAFGIADDPTVGHAPWSNGKIERFHRTVQSEHCAQLPGHIAGTDDRDWHGNPLFDDKDLITADEFIARLHSYVIHYNFNRPHAALRGRTPFEAWIEQCHRPLRRVSDDAVRAAMLPVGTRKVSKTGITYDNRTWLSAELPHPGTKVELRRLPHTDDSIEVFVDGQWVCTAWPSEQLTTDEIDAIGARRGAETRVVRGNIRAGKVHRQAVARELDTADTDGIPVNYDPPTDPTAATGPSPRRHAGRATSPVGSNSKSVLLEMFGTPAAADAEVG